MEAVSLVGMDTMLTYYLVCFWICAYLLYVYWSNFACVNRLVFSELFSSCCWHMLIKLNVTGTPKLIHRLSDIVLMARQIWCWCSCFCGRGLIWKILLWEFLKKILSVLKILRIGAMPQWWIVSHIILSGCVIINNILQLKVWAFSASTFEQPVTATCYTLSDNLQVQLCDLHAFCTVM